MNNTNEDGMAGNNWKKADAFLKGEQASYVQSGEHIHKLTFSVVKIFPFVIPS